MGRSAGAALKSIHVLRKPCSESTVAANVLRHGIGAVNVDECRIATGAKEPDSGAMYYKNRGLPMPSNKQNYFAPGDTKRITLCNPIVGGRWPANLILQHLDGCVQDGVKKVKGAGHYPAARSAGSQISGPSGHTGQANLTERHLKEETVTAWACVQGCPIAALDAQSGELTSGSWNGHRNKAKTKPGIYAPFVLRDEVGTQGSKGGASRFFKQVKP